jgi:glucokinase
VANPKPTTVLPLNATTRPFIAADVGGTHVRIGLIRPAGAGAPVKVQHYRKYACADYPSPAEIFEDFLTQLDEGVQVDEAVIASAGYLLEDGSLIAANLPWPLVPGALRERLGFRELRVVNDFEAVAHAIAEVDPRDAVLLSGPADAHVAGPILVLGPGTGLGAALSVQSEGRSLVLPTEAGQAALTPGNAVEMALLAELMKQRSHVPVESALSGPGLMNLHAALCAIRAAPRSPARMRWRAKPSTSSAACSAASSATWPCSTAPTAASTSPAASCRRSAISCFIPASSRGSSTRDRCARRWNAFPCGWSSTVNWA